VDFSIEFTAGLAAVFVTLFVLELVLGVDSVILLSILTSKLPTEQQAKARNLGLTLAMLIGVFLVAEGLGVHIDKAFIYGPMAFASFVEVLNLSYAASRAKREQKRQQAVQLRPTYTGVDESIAVSAALSRGTDTGLVRLSRKPIQGAPGHERRAGLG
jgi:predicted tellurium resistance membrane protein TerC